MRVFVCQNCISQIDLNYVNNLNSPTNFNSANLLTSNSENLTKVNPDNPTSQFKEEDLFTSTQSIKNNNPQNAAVQFKDEEYLTSEISIIKKHSSENTLKNDFRSEKIYQGNPIGQNIYRETDSIKVNSDNNLVNESISKAAGFDLLILRDKFKPNMLLKS
jgi:hypothetical protein